MEIKKLQKLGKVELLELVRELMEELEEVRLHNEAAVKSGEAEKQERMAGKVVSMKATCPPYSGYGRLPPLDSEALLAGEGGQSPPEGMQPKLIVELEGFRRTILEICEMAERTRAEMDRCMARIKLSMQQRENEDKQMVEQVDKMMETVKSLQRVIQ